MGPTTADDAVVRRLEPADTDAVADAFAALAADPDTRRWFHPHPLTAAEAQRACASTGGDRYLGAFVGGSVAGYALLRGWDDGFEVPTFGVAVDPDHRGGGVGDALLTASVDLARSRGAEELLLHVHPSNTLARSWYERRGFVRSGVRADGLIAYRLRLAAHRGAPARSDPT